MVNEKDLHLSAIMGINLILALDVFLDIFLEQTT